MLKRSSNNSAKNLADIPDPGSLFSRVVSILEQARANAVRSVNGEMVAAYWFIGREIVRELQGGHERAKYGKRILEGLSRSLSRRFGEGYSLPNLKNFRQFYQTYSDRNPETGYPSGSQFSDCFDSGKSFPTGSESKQGFHPGLTWSHYRALMRVENAKARHFYETESSRCGWTKRELERQISTLYYERLLKSGDKVGMLSDSKTTLLKPVEVLKDPYVLEFLDLPVSPKLMESDLENALIANLQNFLLELGKGFSFVARQKRVRIGRKDFYVDLVFYNYLLKCFVLIDLKVGELTHQDIGQMDGYIRVYEEKFRTKDGNPTIGLILCSDKDDAIVHYSVLKENKRLFASRYKLVLPDEEELRTEIERERKLIEGRA